MPCFHELNLNVTNLSPKAIEQLVEYTIKCKFKKTCLLFFVK